MCFCRSSSNPAQAMVDGESEVGDGGQILTLLMLQIEARAEASFTIDLDDTAGSRVTPVTGSEISRRWC